MITQKSNLRMQKKEAKEFHLLMNQLSNECYTGNDGGGLMLVFDASIVPQCGYSGLSTAIPFIIGSLFANTGIPINSELLISS